MIAPLPHIAAMAPYALADLRAAKGKPTIQLAQNESPWPPSPRAIKAVQDVLADARLYSDSEWRYLRSAINEVHGIPHEQILCGAGSMELIACLMRCYAGPGDHIVLSQYGYAFFRTALKAANATFESVPEHDFTVSVDALLAAATQNSRMVCIANPGNPTGTRISLKELVRLRDGLAENTLLVVDEAYGEFADMADEFTFDLATRGNTIILRTFSKAYAMAGMRVGWGIFPTAIASEMRKILNPNNIGIASEVMAAAAMLDQDYMRHLCIEISALRDRFTDRVRAMGLAAPASSTNFVLIRFPDARAARGADQRLRAEGIVLRGMAGYGLPECLRATIGSAEDMEFVAKILTHWCNAEGITC